MDAVVVGMHVEIKRSDGRIHSAVISDVNKPQRSVTVEWFEKRTESLASTSGTRPSIPSRVRVSSLGKRTQSSLPAGETKGKEIDLASLIAYNPQLVSSAHPAAPPPPPVPVNHEVVTSAAQGNRVATRKTTTTTNGATAAVVATSRASNVIAQPPATVVKPAQSTRTTRNQPSSTEMQRCENHNVNATVIYEEPPHAIAHGRANGNMATATVAPLPQAQTVSCAVAGESKGGRRSTVQKIEELEKNREERRAQLEEAKKRQEQQKAIDPGNPNWQFMTMIRDYQAQIDFRPLKITDGVLDNRICVCVRKRPLNTKEVARKEIEVLTIPNRDHVIVHQPQVKVDLTKYLDNQKFRFDYTFDENTSNEMVYKFTAQPLVKTVFDQGFATCFAYGQTGSGKTHTMGGDFTGKVQDCSKGIYALAARDIFKLLASKEYKKESLIAFDLLGHRTKLRVMEDGKKEVNIVGLQELQVHNEQDVLNLIKRGSDVRTAGQTSANTNSSRSHAIFQIILRKKEGNVRKLYGKFSLIDLAGNERGVDTMSSDRQTRMEGAEINKSLLALKECIRAMGRNSAHVPFRASKLTMVLRDSFVGLNARTCMIAMISPGMNSCEHTLNTLRYADRVKELGCDDGSSSPPLNDEDLMLDGDVFDQSASDLALLRTKNEDELDDDAFKFQVTVAHINVAEDRVLDDNQALIERYKCGHAELQRMLRVTERVDYDIESYARDVVAFLTAERQAIDQALANAEKLQKEIRKEDEARLQLQQKQKHKKR